MPYPCCICYCSSRLPVIGNRALSLYLLLLVPITGNRELISLLWYFSSCFPAKAALSEYDQDTETRTRKNSNDRPLQPNKGPWDVYQDYFTSSGFIKSENNSYVSDMQGWHIEVYKNQSTLRSTIIVTVKEGAFQLSLHCIWFVFKLLTHIYSLCILYPQIHNKPSTRLAKSV